MNYWLCFFCIFFLFQPVFLLGADSEGGFTLDVVVDENIIFVVDTVVYDHFSLEYRPGKKELYLNGQVPLFNLKIGPTEDDCAEKYKENEYIQNIIRDGLSCRDAYFVFDDAINSCLMKIKSSANDAKSQGGTEAEMLAQIYSELALIPEGVVVERVFFKDSSPRVFIIGYEYAITVPLETVANSDISSTQQSEAEVLFNFATRLKEDLERYCPVEELYVIGHGGSISNCGGPNMIQRVRTQLMEIQTSGTYVDGPILKPWLHNKP